MLAGHTWVRSSCAFGSLVVLESSQKIKRQGVIVTGIQASSAAERSKRPIVGGRSALSCRGFCDCRRCDRQEGQQGEQSALHATTTRYLDCEDRPVIRTADQSTR